MSNLPVIGAIRKWEDVRRALESLRAYFVAALQDQQDSHSNATKGSVSAATCVFRDSDMAEFQGKSGRVIKDGGLRHVDVKDAVDKKHTQGTDTALGTLGTKNPPIDADLALYRDSTAANALVTSTWTQIKAFLKTYFDGIYAAISGPLALQSFVDTTTGAAPALTSADFGKVHIYSHATTSPTYYLPSVAAGDVGAKITFVKTGTGTITIDAADADTIEDSGTGDTIYSSDTGRVSITLQLVGTTAWKIIDATGTWTTTD